MRIVQIITRSDTLAGAQLHVRDLSRRLVELGHQVTVLVGGSGPLTEALASASIPFVSLKHLMRSLRPASDAIAVLEIRGHLRRLQPDLVAAHSSKAGLVGRLAARTLGIPALFTAHGWAFSEGVPQARRRASRLAEKLAASLTDRIIVVSEYDRRLALRENVCAPEKLVTIHNGVADVAQLGRPGEPRGRTRLIMVARLDAPKRHFDLLEALQSLDPDAWELDLVGDGPSETHIRRRIETLGLGDRVRMLGLRWDIPELVSEARIGILLSDFEGFPLVVLEYMRAGLPVLASDVGGISEAVRHGHSGLLVARGDAGGLCEALTMLVRDPALRSRMGARGREDYLERFTFDRMVDSTLAVYEQTVARSRGARA